MYEFFGESGRVGQHVSLRITSFAGASATDALDWVYGPKLATGLPVTLESN